MSKYKRRGWYGDSHKHALAAKGIKIYAASKAKKKDPLFYAQKREQQVPTSHIRSMVKDGLTFGAMRRMHPDADPQDIRERAIRTIDGMQGNSTLSMIDKNDADDVVRMARSSERKQKNVVNALEDSQMGSFINDVKRESILERLSGSGLPVGKQKEWWTHA